MVSVDEFLTLIPKGKLSEGEKLDSPLRSSKVGLKLIDAPYGVSNGLAYRINGCNLERILVTSDEDTASNIRVIGRCILSGNNVRAVQLKASPDGRLVVVACIDGSLQCYDSTDANISLRWSIPHAHSHEASNISSSLSTDRSRAACGSGPILALDFSPCDYKLVLVDANKGTAIYDARCSQPTNLIKHASSSQQKLVENVSSASWRASFEKKDLASYPLAIGRFDGSIAILSFKHNSPNNPVYDDLLERVLEFDCPSEADGFVCTHLNWTSNTLLAGLCRVISDEDDDEDDDDDDDIAEHEALLFVTSLDESMNQVTEWSAQGDVVPFFSVPKFGRHVFFTSFLPSTTRSELIAVGTNVGTDIGAICSIDESEGSIKTCWHPLEFQEGAAATTPTDEDDEYSFPLGFSILQLPSSSFRLIMAATDGSLSTFEYQHKNDPNYFFSGLLGPTVDLSSDPIVTTKPPPELKNVEGADIHASIATAGIDEKNVELTTGNTPNSSFLSGSNGLSGLSSKINSTQTTVNADEIQNTSSSNSFGVQNPSVFGSGNTTGLTFGTKNTDNSPFASVGRKLDEKSVFGTVPSLGMTPSDRTMFSGGFSSKNTIFSSERKTNSNPFNLLSSKLPASTSIKSVFPTKPLFGVTFEPSSVTNKETFTPLPSSKSPIIQTTIDELGTTRNDPDVPTSEEKTLTNRVKTDAVFEKFDPTGSGCVPVSSFEDMLEALGEGFYGEELDAQVTLVDPTNSGQITKESFLVWYKNLTEESNENVSLDTAEQEERAEEEDSARNAFKELSKTEGDESYILVNQFSDLLESLGSTYCEEEHKKTIAKLRRVTDRIYLKDFLIWYIDWLFGDEDSSIDDASATSTNRKANSVNTSEEKEVSLVNIFKIDEDSWKCEVCSVRNNGSNNKCVACETPRPGYEAISEDNSLSKSAVMGSIGTGGFSFGGSTTGTTSDGFAFGTDRSDENIVTEKNNPLPSVGWTFGSASTNVTNITSTLSTTAYNMKALDSTKSTKPESQYETNAIIPTKPELVFFEADVNNSGCVPVSSFEDMLEALGEGFYGEELDAQVTLVDPTNSGQITKESFLVWYKNLTEESNENVSLDTAEQEERAEEEDSARNAFKELSKTEGDESYILVNQFSDLLESLGSTYCEEEHKKTIAKLRRVTDRIYLKDFLIWYIDWLFGDEDSSIDDASATSTNRKANSVNTSEEKEVSLVNIFKIDEDSWKCEVCSVRNNGSNNKCVACETPRPGYEAISEDNSLSKSAVMGSIGTGGFSFGGSSTVTASKSSASSIGVGGFSFGGKPNQTATATESSTSSTGVGGFSSCIGGGVLTFGEESDPATANKASALCSEGESTSFKGESTPTLASLMPKPSEKVNQKSKNIVASSNTFAAFSPMPSKAPSLFGAKTPKVAETDEPASGVVPPKPVASSSTFAALPPMSIKAPSLFGTKSLKAAERFDETSKNNVAVFPPMSKKAPSPFGAAPPKPVANSNTFTAPPPVSSMASSLFGAKGTKAVEKAGQINRSNFAALPPMSKKAPSPFGAKPREKVDSASSSTFAAHPPLSNKAPSPFGVKSSQPLQKFTGSTFAALPPMSSKSPSPFGTTSSKPVEKPTDIAFDALPPMSNKTPSLFGAKSSHKADQASSSGFAKFSPISNKEQATFGTKAKSSKQESSAGTFTSLYPTPNKTVPKGNVVSSPNLTSQDQKSGTKIQIQLNSNFQSFSRTVREISQMRLESSLDHGRLEQGIEDLATQMQQERSNLSNIDGFVRRNRGQIAFLLSRKTDSSRQIDAARKMIKEIKLPNMNTESSVIDTQGLDQESEMKRREFAALSRSIVRQLGLIRERIALIEATNVDFATGQNKLLESVMNLYTRSKKFDEVSSRVQGKINVASKMLPMASKQRKVTGRSTYGLEIPHRSPKHRNKLRPISLRSGERGPTIQKQARSCTSLASHWKNTESTLQKMGNKKVKVDRFDILSINYTGHKLTSQCREVVKDQRVVTRSLLMSPPGSERSNMDPKDGQSLISSKQSIFFSPQRTPPKARSGWDQPSTLDQDRVKFLSLAAPQVLKQTTLSNASRETLASFGTTPEKLQDATEMKKQELTVPTALPLTSKKAPMTSFSNDKKETVNSLTSKKHNNSKPKLSAAPLPPMPKQAPKNPFSKDIATNVKDRSSNTMTFSASKSSSEPKQKKDKESTLINSKRNEVSSGSIGNAESLNSPFTPSKTSTKSDHLFTASEPMSSPPSITPAQSDEMNPYSSVLKRFYEKHNPTKVGEVGKTLEKYKGRESEMFAKLATKYKVSNPLEATTKVETFSSSSRSPGFGNLGSVSASTPSLTLGMNAVAATSTPFSSLSGTPTASPSFSGGFQPSPFGINNPTTNNRTFGISPSSANMVAPAQTPFGSSSSFGVKTTGGFGNINNQTPFGAAAPSPMQSNSPRLFNGRTARELLLQFYQEKNPSKVTEVDKLLAKYHGNEEHMFRNLAKKYQLDSSVFGVSSSNPNPGFGSPTIAPTFGQASPIGGTSSLFGQSPGFGQPSLLERGVGMSSSFPAAQTFGSGSGSTTNFGTSGFGTLAQTSTSSFGRQSSNFGGGNIGFGGSPHGAPRR